MDLLDFDKKLKKVSGETGRPFICNGSPLDCNVFIVGLNPVVDNSFWDNWNPHQGGFHKKNWLEMYDQKRDKRTTTRNRLESFWHKFNKSDSTQLLETNLYRANSNRANEIPKKDKDSSVFNFLLQVIEPNVIIGHGKNISRYLWHLSGCPFEKKTWCETEIWGFKTNIYCRDHLSYQLSNKDCEKLIDNLYSHIIDIDRKI